MFGVIAFDAHEANQLVATLGPIGQLLLLGRSSAAKGAGWQGFAILRQDRCINGIGFGAQALGTGEEEHTARFEDADREACGLERHAR